LKRSQEPPSAPRPTYVEWSRQLHLVVSGILAAVAAVIAIVAGSFEWSQKAVATLIASASSVLGGLLTERIAVREYLKAARAAAASIRGLAEWAYVHPYLVASVVGEGGRYLCLVNFVAREAAVLEAGVLARKAAEKVRQPRVKLGLRIAHAKLGDVEVVLGLAEASVPSPSRRGELLVGAAKVAQAKLKQSLRKSLSSKPGELASGVAKLVEAAASALAGELAASE